VKPYTILNCASSADGKIALANRKKINLSNTKDFERVHNLRAKCDAIIIGINTVIEDDPNLTVNEKYASGPNPIRIILDTNYRTPKNSKVLNGESETIIVIGDETVDRKLPNVKVFRCGKDEIDLEKLLQYLGKLNAKKILVEGGETVLWSFLEKKLFDELNIFISSAIIGGTDTPSIAGGKGFLDEKKILSLELKKFKQIGNGILLTYFRSNN
tara:strand:- start:507 stop:1148 length:642 start_codon:yes stop_codon:yes gene_type:complete